MLKKITFNRVVSLENYSQCNQRVTVTREFFELMSRFETRLASIDNGKVDHCSRYSSKFGFRIADTSVIASPV